MDVRVKPLVWKQAGGNIKEGEGFSAWPDLAHAPITIYRKHDGWWLSSDCKTYPTIEAAKAAAQADYEARILAALEPAPDLAELVEALRCAVDDYEAHNGRIVSDTDPHWSVSARAALRAKVARLEGAADRVRAASAIEHARASQFAAEAEAAALRAKVAMASEELSLIAVMGYSDDPKVAANIARMAVERAANARAALTDGAADE